ncbi:uncharacterized protein [Henckelia pumila]|uniref:uncharacterized protein n=1 Tax=Henckelia pumila TaxID=405737 RepID=UPI003C6DC7D9
MVLLKTPSNYDCSQSLLGTMLLAALTKGNQSSTETASLATANVLNPPPGFNTQNGEGKASLEDLVSNFIAESFTRFKRNENRLDSMETHLTNVSASMKNLETQIGQLANALNNQQRGVFPSNTEINPREQCKAVILRSGKELGTDNQKTVDDEEIEEIVVESENSDSKNSSKSARFKKKALDEKFSKFLDIFKKIYINIPFADALEQMPHYAKFMKDVIARKRKLEEFETVKLTEERSAILQKKLPQKLKDPGSFTIPCIIGGATVNRALCDLGASINLMPLSIFWSLELGEVKPTTITLQLADLSLTYPRGVVEDVLVKVDKFIFPADFVVLDMEEDQDVPLILGRPFLATDRALIDVQEGELTLRVGGDAVTFNIYKTMKYQDEVHSCNRIDLSNSYENNFCAGLELEDALARCLINSITQFEGDDWELREQFLALESLPKEKDGQEKIGALPEEVSKEVGRLQTLYCFLDGYSGYNQIAIAPEDQEKTTFTCPYAQICRHRRSCSIEKSPTTTLDDTTIPRDLGFGLDRVWELKNLTTEAMSRANFCATFFLASHFSVHFVCCALSIEGCI